jgi:adenylyltransferase/sulfurtransferase
LTNELSKEELVRYARQMIISDFGEQGQLKLKQAKVLVIGAGGLGCPVLSYLTAAGIGLIGIIDSDKVEISNLQRQVLFDSQQVGLFKAKAAEEKLHKLNPTIRFQTYCTKLTSQNALEILKEYDVIVDCTDNFASRYLINDACVLLDKVSVYASVFRFEGQLAVFNYLDKSTNPNLRSPNYRDLFPSPPPASLVPNCSESGIFGVIPGILGCMQASEVLKIILEKGKPLAGKLLLYDALSLESTLIKFSHQTKNKITSLIDYEVFCNVNQKNISKMKEITVLELKEKLDNQEDIQVIDVRKAYEYKIVNIGSTLIPKSEIETQLDKIRRDVPVILLCRSGKRSATVLQGLEKKYAFDNLYNLKGGILAYADQVDTSLTKY